MESEIVQPRPPRYPDEDQRPTSRKELLGFYLYSFAAEVFVVCGVGSFIPITLEQLARDRGVLLSDHSTPCTAHRASRDIFNVQGHHAQKSQQCAVTLPGGLEINTASFAMYTFSISVLLQSLIVITMSGLADHGRHRKTLLLTFAFVGAASTMLFLWTTSDLYLLAAVLAIIGNCCFGASFVLLNSWIPILVRWHPSVMEERSDEHDYQIEEEGIAPVETTTLLTNATEPVPNKPSPAVPTHDLQLSTKISSYGIGVGYLGAVVMQTLSIIIVILTHSTTFSLRLVLFTVGTWWFLFSIPVAYLLNPRPGPPLSSSHGTTWLSYLSYSWRNLFHTIVRARQLKDVLLFLGAWFMLSDAIATVSSTAILFAKTTLNMQPAALSLINVIVTISGIVGAFSWPRISRVMDWSAEMTILACICVFELIPLYGLLGYVPFVRDAGVGGLQQDWEMYPLGAVYGLVLGGLSSYCRRYVPYPFQDQSLTCRVYSLFGSLIPPGQETSFFALYAITDKGSSVFGPAIVGAITDATGEIRPAFGFLALLIAVPVPLLWAVDVGRGLKEAKRLGTGAREDDNTVEE